MAGGLQAGIYWRLSGFYFCYFIVLGTLVPFFPLYLQQLGFDAWQIGLLTAFMVGTKIVAPNVWGWLADRSGQRMRIIRLGSFSAAVSFAAIFLSGSSPTLGGLALVVVLYSFFWNAVLAQFEVVTLQYLGNRPEHYSRIRLWGSIGFITAVVLFGWVFDVFDLSLFPWLVTAGLLGILASSYLVADPAVAAARTSPAAISRQPRFLQRLREPAVAVFFVVCFLMVFSHGPYYTFFSLLLERHDYSRTAIGLLWGLGVVAEVVLFWVMHRLLPLSGLRAMLLVSLALTAIRWLLLAMLPGVLPVMLVAQCLHAFSFGAFHAAAIEAVRRLFPLPQSGQAQAFYSAVGYGAGNAAGSLLAGVLWQGSPHAPFLLSAAVCLLAFMLVWRMLPGTFLQE